jgi:TonB family protein
MALFSVQQTMRPRLWPAVLLAVSASVPLASLSRAQTQPASSAASPQAAYEDSADGLKSLIQAALKAAKENDQAKLAALTSSMALPDPESWFSSVFGPEAGAMYAHEYSAGSAVLARNLASEFSDLAAEKFTGVDVHWFTDSCDDRAGEDEYPVLAAREQLVPVSTVLFSHGSLSQEMRYLAYVDGGFRFLGDLRTSSAWRPPNALQAGKDAPMPRVVKQVAPVYPGSAVLLPKSGERNVKLQVVIGRDGSVTDIRVLRGPCVFAKAATKAVRKWRFAPPLVDGKPVEVWAEIEVRFHVY